VKVVDVLGDHQHLARPAALQLGQRQMRRIRPHGRIAQLSAPVVVEAMHAFRVARKRLRRRHLLEALPLPQPVLAAEGRQPGFSRDAGPGQHHDARIRADPTSKHE
jgi:hypothetical protein